MASTLLPLLALLPAALSSPVNPLTPRQLDTSTFTETNIYTFENGVLPDGLFAGSWEIPALNIVLGADLITVSDGYANLRVPGGQSGPGPYRAAELNHFAENILYGSVRTTAVFSGVHGTCQSSFFYRGPPEGSGEAPQEIDIEWLSDPTSLSNPGDGSRPFWYTNQDINGVFSDRTAVTGPSPSDLTTAEHEYRIDWLPGVTRFFIDGELQQEFTTDVPFRPGNWLWNNWANGDQGWTGALPTEDSVYRIRRIEMYYNVTEV